MPFRSRGTLVAALLSASALIPATASAATTGAWSSVATPLNLEYPAVIPAADGDVYAVGGTLEPQQSSSAAALRFDHRTRTWVGLAQTLDFHVEGIGAPLPGGKALVAGGSMNMTAEVYDPAADAWRHTAGGLNVNRQDADATALTDGRVLVVGGVGVDSAAHGAEVYDPATDSWTLTAPMHVARTYWPSVTRLRDGRVLVTGGRLPGGESYTAASEIFDPVANTWTDVAPLPAPGAQVQTTLLPDGRVVAAGGFVSGYEGFTWSARSEVYDPAANTWTAVGDLPARAGSGASMVLTGDGRPLLVNGFTADGDQTSAETFNPATATWTPTPALASSHFEGAVAVLGDGDVLVAGGDKPQAPTELFHLTTVPDPPAARTMSAPAPAPAPKPAPAKPQPAAAAALPKGLKTLKFGKTGKVSLKLTCSAGSGTCRTTLRLTTRARHPKTLAHATFTAKPGKSATVTLKLPKSVLSQLKHHHTLKAQLTLGKHTLAVTLRSA